MAWKMSVSASETNVNIVNNTSDIYAKISITTSGSSWNGEGTAYVKISAPGMTTKKVPFSINKTSTKTIYDEIIHTFPHNPDGSLSPITVTFSGHFTSNASSSKEVIVNMTTIPRATMCPQLSGTVSDPMTIYINPVSSNFSHKMYVWYNNQWQKIIDNVVSGMSYTPPTAWLSYIPNNQTSNSFSLLLETYSNGSYVGNSSSTFTYYGTEALMRPIINNVNNLIDVNPKTIALTNNSQMIVKGFSTGQFSLSNNDITYKYGATFKKYEIYVNNIAYINENNTIITLSNLTNSLYAQRVYDSRNYNSDTWYTIGDSSRLINYFAPYLEKLEIDRPNPLGDKMTMNVKANWFDNKFGPDGVQNALTAKWRVKQNNGQFSEWQSLNTASPENIFSMETFTSYEKKDFLLIKLEIH